MSREFRGLAWRRVIHLRRVIRDHTYCLVDCINRNEYGFRPLRYLFAELSIRRVEFYFPDLSTATARPVFFSDLARPRLSAKTLSMISHSAPPVRPDLNPRITSRLISILIPADRGDSMPIK